MSDRLRCALQDIDQRRRQYPDAWSREAYRNIAQGALRQRDEAIVRAEADEQLIRDLRETIANAGPWPTVIDDGDWGYYCLHCSSIAIKADEIIHDDDCSGIALANALARLQGDERGRTADG